MGGGAPVGLNCASQQAWTIRSRSNPRKPPMIASTLLKLQDKSCLPQIGPQLMQRNILFCNAKHGAEARVRFDKRGGPWPKQRYADINSAPMPVEAP